MPCFDLRNATPEDVDLSYRITEEAMRDYVLATWGAWSEPDQRERHRAGFTPVNHQIVLVSGKAVGLVAIEECVDHISLLKLYLRRSARDKGLGSAVLGSILVAADEKSLPVRLHVLRVNRAARRFYLRHGFRHVGETPEHYILCRGN
jgi:ribosomal protein S18 acetylase RimI-like enzyme